MTGAHLVTVAPLVKFIALGIELHAAHEDTDIKQKNAKFWVETHKLSLFPHKVH